MALPFGTALSPHPAIHGGLVLIKAAGDGHVAALLCPSYKENRLILVPFTLDLNTEDLNQPDKDQIDGDYVVEQPRPYQYCNAREQGDNG